MNLFFKEAIPKIYNFQRSKIQENFRAEKMVIEQFNPAGSLSRILTFLAD